MLQQAYIETWALTGKEAGLPTAEAVTPHSQPPISMLAVLSFTKAGNCRPLQPCLQSSAFFGTCSMTWYLWGTHLAGTVQVYPLKPTRKWIYETCRWCQGWEGARRLYCIDRCSAPRYAALPWTCKVFCKRSSFSFEDHKKLLEGLGEVADLTKITGLALSTAERKVYGKSHKIWQLSSFLAIHSQKDL